MLSAQSEIPWLARKSLCWYWGRRKCYRKRIITEEKKKRDEFWGLRYVDLELEELKLMQRLYVTLSIILTWWPEEEGH